MRILAIGASDREINWWKNISKFIDQHDIDYLNCSSKEHKGCFNLKNYANSLINFSPSISDKINIKIYELMHEHYLYPRYSFRNLYKKYQIHLNAYEKFFSKEKFDLIIGENGGFIFINSLLAISKQLNIPLILLEGSDEPNYYFAYLNEKGPNLDNAIKSINYSSENNLIDLDLLIQDKDRKVDQRFIKPMHRQLQSFISYLVRRKKSKFISTDGSFRVVLSLKLEYLLKYLILILHNIKSIILAKNIKKIKKRIIFPLQLERDFHLTERTNYHSQTEFLLSLCEKSKEKLICFKLHPHSLILGPSLIDHVRILFSRSVICKDKPTELDVFYDEVHTLGSKYGLQAARNKIKTYIYGQTFYNPFKNNYVGVVEYKKRLLVIDNNKENFYSKYKHKIYLYLESKFGYENSAIGLNKLFSSIIK